MLVDGFLMRFNIVGNIVAVEDRLCYNKFVCCGEIADGGVIGDSLEW